MVLRELFVKLGLSVDEASFAKGQLAANLLTKGIEKLAHWAAEAGHSLVHHANEAIEYGDRIKKASQSVGIASQALQELQHAGELADVSAEEMSQSIGILSRKMLEAKNGSKEAGAAFKGIKFQEDGKLLATDEVLGNIADKFQSMPDGAEKTAMAMQLFGRAGKQMIPMLNKGAEDLEELRKEAHELGLVLDDEVVDQSEELKDNLHRLHLVSTGLWRQFMTALIPSLTKIAHAMVPIAKGAVRVFKMTVVPAARAVVDVMRRLWEIMKVVGGFFYEVGKGIHFMVTQLQIAKIMLGWGGLYGALWLVASGGAKAALQFGLAWAKALLPFTLLFLILDDIRVFMRGGDSLLGDFVKWLEDWQKPRDGDSWFIQQLKEFVRYITEAINLLKDLDEVFGDGAKSRALVEKRAGSSRNEIQRRADNQTLDTARQRLAQGLPLTDAEKTAMGRQGVTEAAFTAQYAPSARPEMRASSVAGGANVNAPVNINVTAAPGQSAAEVGGAVKEAISSWWHGTVSATVAQVKR